MAHADTKKKKDVRPDGARVTGSVSHPTWVPVSELEFPGRATSIL